MGTRLSLDTKKSKKKSYKKKNRNKKTEKVNYRIKKTIKRKKTTKRKKSKYLGKSPYKLKRKVKNNSKFINTIYYFFAEYCGYCTRFDQLFNKLKNKYKDKIHLKKIDGKKPINEKLITDYGIKLFPTLIVKETKKPYIGDRGENDLTNFIKSSI